MTVKYTFESDKESPTVIAVSNALIDIQRLWLFVAYLEMEDEDVPLAELFEQFLFQDDTRQRIELFGDYFPPFLLYPGYKLYVGLQIKRISYASPLEIETDAPTLGKPAPGRIKRILDVLKKIVSLDHIREKAKWEAEIARQHAIAAALKNEEHIMKMANKIRNEEKREEFVRRLSATISSLTGEGPQPKMRLSNIEYRES
jgi:hypothetical protein